MIHNHGTEQSAGLACRETRRLDGTLRGACLPRRQIADAEIRLGVGRWGMDSTPPEGGPWYVTRYSRDGRHDQAVGWFPTWGEAMRRANALVMRGGSRDRV